MSGHRNILRWLAVLTAVVLLAAACSSDSGDASPFAPPNDSGDTGPDSADSGDTGSGSNDSGSADSGDTGSDSADSGLSPAAPTATNCADIQAAFESVGGAVTGTGSGENGDDLRASFDTFRAQLQALRSEAPEVSDDIDAAIAGLDVLGSAFADFNWDVSNLSDPQDAIAFASLMTDGDVMGLFTSMGNIGAWIAANCAS